MSKGVEFPVLFNSNKDGEQRLSRFSMAHLLYSFIQRYESFCNQLPNYCLYHLKKIIKTQLFIKLFKKVERKPVFKQQLSAHVKRVYEDGEVVEANSEELRELVNAHEELLISKHEILVGFKSDTRRKVVDYYLPLNNLEYQNSGDTQYFVGASNTEQTTGIRLKFKIDDCLLYLDHCYKSSGSFATTFLDLLNGEDGIFEIIECILEQGKPIEEVGIERVVNEDDSGEGNLDEEYRIVVANELYAPFDFEIEKKELLRSLVGIEVYNFDLKIKD